MTRSPRLSRRWKMILGSLALALGMSVPGYAQDISPRVPPIERQTQPGSPPVEHVAPAVHKLDLDTAVQQALGNQPTLRAARAGQNASIASRQAADSPFAIFSGPQIKYRRQQADLGVQIADANLQQVELETVNAVTRTYLGVLYAREQQQIAEKAHSQLEVVHRSAKRAVEEGTSKDITKLDVERLETYMLLAKTRVEEAKLGMGRAKAALREAIGLPCQTPIEIGDEKLSKFYDDFAKYRQARGANLSIKDAVAAAVQRRAELRQATLASQVHCLEVEAQGVIFHPTSRTFAAMSDIHGKILPASIIDGDYRPGPVGPEMPVYLAGSREDRVARAQHFYERSLAVVDKARGLISLEVEEACARLLGNGEQIAHLESAAQKTKNLYEKAEAAYRADPVQNNLNQLLQIQLLEAQTRAQLNDAYYKFGQALASLQRATVGAIWECFVAK
jgi:outer membrane protein TolC